MTRMQCALAGHCRSMRFSWRKKSSSFSPMTVPVTSGGRQRSTIWNGRRRDPITCGSAPWMMHRSGNIWRRMKKAYIGLFLNFSAPFVMLNWNAGTERKPIRGMRSSLRHRRCRRTGNGGSIRWVFRKTTSSTITARAGQGTATAPIVKRKSH